MLHFSEFFNGLFIQVQPGLSAYAKNVTAAAESLIGLLEKAEAAVPEKLHGSTPVRLGVSTRYSRHV